MNLPSIEVIRTQATSDRVKREQADKEKLPAKLRALLRQEWEAEREADRIQSIEALASVDEPTVDDVDAELRAGRQREIDYVAEDLQHANTTIFNQATALRAKEDARAEKKKGKEKADPVVKLELSDSDSDDNMKNVPPVGYQHRTTVTIGDREPARSPRAEL